MHKFKLVLLNKVYLGVPAAIKSMMYNNKHEYTISQIYRCINIKVILL